jgi:Tol biopolymer transport system component
MRTVATLTLGFLLAACQTTGATTPAPTTAPAVATPPPATPTSASTAAAPTPGATISPASGRIAFMREGDASVAGIFTVDADGQHERKILSADYQVPRWSPDGTLLSVAHILDDANGVVVPAIAQPDGSGVHDLPLSVQGLHCGVSVWRPDGIWLAAECWDDADTSKTGIWLLRAADGSDLHQLTTTPGIPGGFSADGSELVFTADDGPSGIVNFDGSNLRKPAGLQGIGSYAGFLPDGTIFANIGGALGLFDENGDRLGTVPARQGKLGEPRAYPDGSWFVFLYRAAGATSNGIFRMGRDGTGLTVVADAPDVDEVAPDWTR